ncbi:MAG: hypothetical protein FJ121_14255 [Deltaproteobacteria bacterium]|nr:hypothetical protein [Deltaproteobacteria bacterium]
MTSYPSDTGRHHQRSLKDFLAPRLGFMDGYLLRAEIYVHRKIAPMPRRCSGRLSRWKICRPWILFGLPLPSSS